MMGAGIFSRMPTPAWMKQFDISKQEEPNLVKHQPPVDFPELPSYVQMKNNTIKGPSAGQKANAWMQGPGGDALLQAGLSMLSDSGPRPQGTGPSLGESLAKAGMVFSQSYKQGKAVEEMDAAINNPELLAGLTERQKRLLKALPPAQAMQVLTAVEFNPTQRGSLQQVRDPQSGLVHLIDPHSGRTVRTMEVGKEQDNLSFQKLDDGSLVGLDPKSGREVVRLSADAQKDDAKRNIELRNNFETKGPVKVWQESQVQLKAAQEAAAAQNGSADLSLMIAAAKILDPNSVVREGEIGLQDMAASANDQVRGLAKQWFTNDGRLSNSMRQNILNTVERTARQRWNAFQQEMDHLRPLYSDLGADPDLIFGQWADPTYVTLSRGVPRSNLGPTPSTDPNGPSTLELLERLKRNRNRGGY